MKPTHLAKLLNIDPATLRAWAGRDFPEFLSPSAAGINGARRTFGETDARIMAWVAILKAQNTAPNEIRLALKQAQADNWRDLPPLPRGLIGDEPVTLVPLEAVEERARALEERFKVQITTLEKERDDFKSRMERAETENTDLRQRLNAVTDKLLELNGRLTALLEKERRRK